MDILLLILRFLLAALLYAFLAVVLLTLWRDLRQTTTIHETERPRGHLIIMQTESESLTTGTVFLLQTVTSIGRSPNNTIFLPDPYASTRHALLAWREGQWWLDDQNSRNGTRLNGARVASPTIVSPGDVIGVGRTELKLEME